MTKSAYVVSLLLFVGGVTAQTTAHLNQLRGDVSANPTLMALVAGKLRAVRMPQDMTLTCVAEVCELTLRKEVPSSLEIRVVRVTATMTTWVFDRLPVNLTVIRNGLELSEKIDYDVENAVLTFRAESQPIVGDVLKLKYQ